MITVFEDLAKDIRCREGNSPYSYWCS